MNTILLRCARLLARFHFWTPAAFVLSRIQPFALWSDDTKSRFAYACMMERNAPLILQVYAKLLRSELGVSAEADLWLARIAWTLGRMELACLILRRTAKADCPLGLKSVVNCQQQFLESILDHSLGNRLSTHISSLALPDKRIGPLIIAPVSSRYLALYELWRQQLDHNYPGHLLLLALDTETVARLQHKDRTTVLDLSPYFVFHQGNIIDRYARNNLWILRVLILRELVARNHSVLSLDLDALVIGNLSELIESLPPCDMVAQEDYSIPMDVARKFGFILCCGFMLLRPKPTTIAFLERYVNQTILEMDDQLALNHLLANSGIANRVCNRQYMQFNSAGVSWVCPNKSLVSRDIHYGSIVRHFQQVGQTVEELKKTIGTV